MAAKKPTAKFMEITPDLANAWLERNTQNRRVKNRVVEGYVRDMALGRWEITGEALCFGPDGVLLDGQHRLIACVRAGKPFTSLVAENVSGQANHDGGPRRTLNDALVVRQEQYSTQMAAAIRVVAYFDLAKKNLDPSRRPVALTLADYINTLEKRPTKFAKEAKESVRLYMPSERVFAPGTVAGLHMLFERANKEVAEWFRLRLYDGHNLSNRSAIFHLRRAFMAQQPGDRLTPREKSALIIKAFNSSIRGQDAPHLTWRASGPRAEAFPEIEGL